MAQCTLGNEVLTGSFLGWWGEDGPTQRLHVLLRGRDGETWPVGGEGGETTQQRNGLKVQEDTVASMLSLPLVSAQCPEHWIEGCRDHRKLGIIRNGLQTDLRLSPKQTDRMIAQATRAPHL